VGGVEGAAIDGLTLERALPRAITLADVAREAGTSPSTASRALSGRGYVSPNARARLLAAADRLGYVPNASARTLKQRTSRVVGVVVSDLGNTFYADVAMGIEQTLRAARYQMVLLSDNSDREQEIAGIRTFVAMRAAGVIITPVDGAPTELLRRHGVHVVEVDRRLAGATCDAVVVDNERGARDATAHLLAAGHRRVALLVAKTDWTTDVGRVNGYHAAHAELGAQIDERLVLPIEFHAPDAEERIERLLRARKPTAIFAANNALAEHAWRVLRRLELRIPDDVSLVAFDDVPWMEMVEPGITAVAQPQREIGRRAAELLLRRVEQPSCPPIEECLEPTLVVRGSVAPRPQRRRKRELEAVATDRY
jgi:LacI family transcriptional regulator